MSVEKCVLERLEGHKPEHEHEFVECPICKDKYCCVCITNVNLRSIGCLSGRTVAWLCPLCGEWVRLDSGTTARGYDPIYDIGRGQERSA